MPRIPTSSLLLLAMVPLSLAACDDWEELLPFPCAQDQTCPPDLRCNRDELCVRVAKGDLGEDWTEPKSLLAFVPIPGGTFRSGCVPIGEGDDFCLDRHEPVVKQVGKFSIGKTEVTVQAYGKCVSAGACTAPLPLEGLDDPGCNWARLLGNHPVNCVDWYQAGQFCHWIGGELPSNDVWEYAFRSGREVKYPWGNKSPDPTRLHFDTTGTAPVGSYPDGASPWGLFDMAGNVREWTSARVAVGSSYRSTDPQDSFDEHRVPRFWDEIPPDIRSDDLGFRCIFR